MIWINTVRKVLFATAGEVNKDLLEKEENLNLPDKYLTVEGQEIEITDHVVFRVEGESMAVSKIFSGDYIWVKPLSDPDRLKQNQIIVLEIDPDKVQVQQRAVDSNHIAKYKLRKFITLIDIELDENVLFTTVLRMDIRSQFEGNKARFSTKLSEFKKNYSGVRYCLLSVTYREGERDYSFHPKDKLFGVVEYKRSSREERKVNGTYCVLESIKLTNDDTLDFTEVVRHLSSKSLCRFFYCITNDQSIIVLAQLFESAKTRIRLVSNKMSPQITSDERYRKKLKDFLEREHTELSLFIYEYDAENPIYKLLGCYSRKVTVKTNTEGMKFILKNKIVNFCVADDSMFRLETDTDTRMSECNFNDKNTCGNLIKLFDDIFNQNESKVVTLPE